MSSLNDMLGMDQIVHGKVTGVLATDAALTSNDGSATLARSTDTNGLYTITFGQAFNAVPTVNVTIVDATFSTDAANGAVILAAATNSVQIQCWEAVTNGAGTDILNVATDLSFHFTAFGDRNN